MLVVSRLKDQSMMLGDDLMVTVAEIQTERALIAISRKAGDRITFWEESYRQWLDIRATLPLGVEIDVTVVQINDDKVRIGVRAPRDLTVHRKEIYDLIHPFE